MEFQNRKCIRLKNYDYTQNGAYFITICTQDRKPVFGEIKNGFMLLNEAGKIAYDEINNTRILRKENNLYINYFVIMPNHVHFIAEIVGTRRAVSKTELQIEAFSKPVANSVCTIVRSYKAAVTKRIHELYADNDKIWQGRFYEHIIRNEQDYVKIAEYILNNPKKWNEDCFYC